MSDNLKSKVVKGTFWALLERISGQLVSFGVGIILARLLSPTDYGTVALLGIFIGDRSCHGKGYGFQALQALKRKASEELRLRAIMIDVAAENLSAVRIYEKCGAVRCSDSDKLLTRGRLWMQIDLAKQSNEEIAKG